MTDSRDGGGVLRVMSVNLQYGGRTDANGNPEPRWDGLAQIIDEQRPDVLLVQEAFDWAKYPHLHADAEHDLAMRGLLAPSFSGGHTLVMYRPQRLRWRDWETRYALRTLHGFGVAVFDVPGLPVPFTVISVHLTPYSAQAAAQEAQLITARLYRYGGCGLIGGDCNYLPLGDTEPDWHTTATPYNVSARTIEHPGGVLVGDRSVGEVFRRGQLVDVAPHHADTTGDVTYRAGTGRSGIRVDQFHITDNLTPAITLYRIVPTGAFSDHDAILVDLDPTKATPEPFAWV